MKPKIHYIEELISQGENLFQDFKFAINDSKKIARTLVAFSNSKGGRLLIGVKDNGSIAGIRTDEEYHMIQGASELYCKPKISFETHDWTVNGKKVLEIIIPESSNKPHMAPDENNKWIAYVRINDENIVANAVLMHVWRKQKNIGGIKIENSEPGQKLLRYLSTNETITLTGFSKLAKITYKKAVKILSDLIVIGLLEINYFERQFTFKTRSENNL